MTPCVVSEAGLNNNGYGRHRRIYRKAHGEVPKGYDVAHVCHNRACENPEHLVLKTRAENMAMSSGRPRRGKLSSVQVRAIKGLRAAGFKELEIAQTLHIYGSTVAKVLLGYTYAGIGG